MQPASTSGVTLRSYSSSLFSRLWMAALSLVGAAPSCSEAPYPTRRAELRLGEEVFRVFCSRVAKSEHPNEPDGSEDLAACDGEAARREPTGRLSALLQRRPAVVTALDQVFGEGPTAHEEGHTFAEGELEQFLAQLMPLYDDGTLPEQTRALARVIEKLLRPDDPLASDVLQALAREATRAGYREPKHVLGLLRPSLVYDRADRLAETLLPLIGEGGAAHRAIVQLLEVAALELAEPAAPASDPDETTLHVVKELLFRGAPAFSSPSEPQAYFVRRDADGYALKQRQNAEGEPTPFPVAGRADTALRDAHGRALDAHGSTPLYAYEAVNGTFLAALLRDQKQLAERTDPTVPSTLEKAARGLRPLLGRDVPRTEVFTASDGTTRGEYTFMGPDVEHSPLLELVHALAVILGYPETERALAVLQALQTDHESAANALVHAALAIADRADLHPEAQLVGIDGRVGGPHEFWDDFLDVLMREAERPGMIAAARIEAMVAPQTAASFRIYGRLMKYKDDVPYNAAPLSPAADGRFSDAAAKAFNAKVSHTYTQLVDRSRPGLDVGMNRSVMQRFASGGDARRGQPTCNKQGATFNIPLILGLQLPLGPLDRCTMISTPDSQFQFPQSVIGRAKLVHDPNIKDQATEDLVGDALQSLTQIEGFRVYATPAAIIRMMGPWNQFLTDLLEAPVTRHGVAVRDFEPNVLVHAEVEHADITVDGAPQSYLTSSAPMIRAYDDHEYFEQSEHGPLPTKGYMYLETNNVLHAHYASRRATGCPLTDDDPICRELGLKGIACAAGCTQSLDPSKPYYSKQSNLVSYEPLISEALEDDRIGDALHRQAKALAQVSVDGKPGTQIIGEFLERLLQPDPALRYRDGRKVAVTNTCVLRNGTSSDALPSCDCPHGTTPVDESSDGACVFPSGVKVPRGRVIAGGIPPLYLLLDAYERIDEVFHLPENAERLQSWLEARSALVEQFLAITRREPSEVGGEYEYEQTNQRSRHIAIQLLDWLRARIRHYRELGQRTGKDEVSAWALGLPDRLASVLGHPLVPPLLDLLDVLWTPEHAQAAQELSRYQAFLYDPQRADSFVGLLVAISDTLELLDRDQALSPVVRFAALALADDAFEALDSLSSGAARAPDVRAGLALRSLRVSQSTATLKREEAEKTPMSRLLANAALAHPALDARAPLQVFYDAVADVNRVDPSQSTATPHSPADIRAVFAQLHAFLMDPDHGLERTYVTIRERTVHR